MNQESQKFAAELATIRQRAAHAATEPSGKSHAPSIRKLGEGLGKLAALLDALGHRVQAIEGTHQPCLDGAALALALHTERAEIAALIREWPKEIPGREQIIKAILARGQE